MEKLKALWTGEWDQVGFDEFSKYFDVTCAGSQAAAGGTGGPNAVPLDMADEEGLIKLLQDKDVYICGYEKVTENVIKSCPNLKLLLSVRDGAEENVDVKAAEAAGLPVFTSAGRCRISVAELTFALMLLMARPIVRMTNYIHENGWTKENGREVRALYNDFSTELFGKTVGIIGIGRNGYQLAQFCKPFNMNIITYDPYCNKEAMEAEGIKVVDLETLMSTADYVIVLARLTPETQGMVSREMIGLMKPNAVLINTGRGKLIDNDALMDALEQDKIKGACLDAHVTEPIGPDSRELKIAPEKLIITPHMAGKTAERNWHQYQLLLEQFRKFIAGEPVRMIYTPKAPEAEGWATRGGKLIELFK